MPIESALTEYHRKLTTANTNLEGGNSQNNDDDMVTVGNFDPYFGGANGPYTYENGSLKQ